MFAQGLMVAVTPLLTRLYTPEDFGLLAVYVSALSIVSVVASLRYNIAIPIPESDAEAFELLTLSLITAGAFSLLLALPLVMAPEFLTGWHPQYDMTSVLCLLPIGIFLAAAYDALQHWSLRMGRYWIVTSARVARAATASGVQVGFGLASASGLGLILGQIMLSAVGLLGLGLNLISKDRALICDFRLKQCFTRAREYRRFPVFSVPEALMNTMSAELPIILIAAMAVGAEAGYIMLATRVVGLPMALIGSSVAQTYLSTARHKLAEGTLVAFTRSTMWGLCRAGAIPIAIVGILSPSLFPLIFGAEWERAGYLVAWMAPWFCLQFVASPVSMILHVLGKQLWAAQLQLVGLILRIGIVCVAAEHFPERVGEAFALSGAVFYALYITTIIALMRERPC